MKKHKIAIIDNGINSELVKCIVENKITIDENNKYKNDDIEINVTDFQHGTICALIIEKYYSKSRLTSIRILDKDGNGLIERLEPALKWCYMNGIYFINLSLGTTNFNDCDMLNRLMNKYTYMGLIIIAATSNDGFLTYPASFSNVIGVSTNDNNSKCSDKYVHLGIDIIAPSEHVINMYGAEFNTPLSNSYAAPYVSALIARKIDIQKLKNICTIKNYISNENRLRKGFSYEPDWIYKAYMPDIKNESNADYYFEVINNYYEDIESEIDTIIVYSLNKLKQMRIENKNLVYLGEEDIGNIYTNGFKWSKNSKLQQILDNEYTGKGLDVPLIILDIDNSLDEYFILLELKRIFREAGYNAYVIGTRPESMLYKLEYIPDMTLEKQKLRNFIEAQTYYKQSDLILWSVSKGKKDVLYNLYSEYSLEIVFIKIEKFLTVCMMAGNEIIFEKKICFKFDKMDIKEIFEAIESYLA